MITRRCILIGLLAGLPGAASHGAIDPDSMARLQRNLLAWHRLAPDVQNRVRILDRTLFEEDAATRQRLLAVAQRYAAWFNRLSDEDRARIGGTPAGPERVRAIREVLDRHWFEGLPKSFHDEYAANPTERPALLEKWKVEERERRNERAEALRDIEFGRAGPQFMDKSFRNDVAKYVRETLEPRLNEREKRRLHNAVRANYYVQVAALSHAHGLKPPGPPEVWKRLAERKPRFGPPD